MSRLRSLRKQLSQEHIATALVLRTRACDSFSMVYTVLPWHTFDCVCVCVYANVHSRMHLAGKLKCRGRARMRWKSHACAHVHLLFP